MHNLILSPISISELDLLIKKAVQTAFENNKQSPAPAPPPDFKYIPIQSIFDRKICSKPTFYEHLKKGEFHLYKFGNKSFVDAEEFLKAFHKVQLH